MGYVIRLMDATKKGKGGEPIVGELEVYRASPFEFCLTEEPLVIVGADAATSVVYRANSEAEQQPILAHSVTFQG
jgi:hypothetical protein